MSHIDYVWIPYEALSIPGGATNGVAIGDQTKILLNQCNPMRWFAHVVLESDYPTQVELVRNRGKWILWSGKRSYGHVVYAWFAVDCHLSPPCLQTGWGTDCVNENFTLNIWEDVESSGSYTHLADTMTFTITESTLPVSYPVVIVNVNVPIPGLPRVPGVPTLPKIPGVPNVPLPDLGDPVSNLLYCPPICTTLGLPCKPAATCR